jgi:hypothetical protein
VLWLWRPYSDTEITLIRGGVERGVLWLWRPYSDTEITLIRGGVERGVLWLCRKTVQQAIGQQSIWGRRRKQSM